MNVGHNEQTNIYTVYVQWDVNEDVKVFWVWLRFEF